PAPRPAGTHGDSCPTAVTSGFVRMSRVAGDMDRTSLPAMSGAAMIAHRLKCARYSSSVMPPFPTSSMSGSFHAPGRAMLACCDERSSREIMDDHLSWMSPVVRHRLPICGAHSHGWFDPHSQILKTIGRPALEIGRAHV